MSELAGRVYSLSNEGWLFLGLLSEADQDLPLMRRADEVRTIPDLPTDDTTEDTDHG